MSGAPVQPTPPGTPREDARGGADSTVATGFETLTSLLGAIAVMAAIGFPVLLLFVVPRFESIFVTLGVDLPLPTKLFLRMSRAAASPVGLCAAIGLLGVWVFLFSRAVRAGRWRLLLAACLFFGVVDLSVVGALYLPVVKVRQALDRK